MNKSSTNECMPSPAGDPWITCRSKSHHRRIYYYNTITGEAIWNLTDFEVKLNRTLLVYHILALMLRSHVFKICVPRNSLLGKYLYLNKVGLFLKILIYNFDPCFRMISVKR